MTETTSRDYSQTLYLPQTEFPMRAGLPKKEPEIIARWKAMDLYRRLRDAAKDRDKYILHDGPPYANGNIHIGHALNKTLKDIVTRSMQMQGWDSNYVPGWDCHGLPIEWKIEEQYRARGKNKDEVPINEFRRECRDFASHWIGVQREEFRRLGIEGDWENPYLTMNFEAEAFIAGEIMKFATSGQLYRGSKPVMWSVVEKTALAEAEIEYHDYQSDQIWVKFPVVGSNIKSTRPAREVVKTSYNHETGEHEFDDSAAQKWATERNALQESIRKDVIETNAAVVIWTTTPWTIPGNRAISFSSKIHYGLYEVTQDDLPAENWVRKGDRLILADALAGAVFEQSRIERYEHIRHVSADELAALTCAHPLRDAGFGGYDFDVPLLDGDHVTDDTGTGFVHTAPGHGTDDFEIWTANRSSLEARGISTAIPFTVADDGVYTKDAPGFEGAQVITHKGEKGDANKRVIEALKASGNLIGLGRLKHQYPHSWRSKKPIIFRNTPQWFVHMDKPIDGASDTLRARALAAIDATRFVPESGQNRLRSMIENRPDWVLSRQRAWGVPIAVFRNEEDGRLAPGPDFPANDKLIARIRDAFTKEGADAWFADGAKERFLDGLVNDPQNWTQVRDILDVWFDSGSTHAFCLEQREDLKPHRQGQGGKDYVLYLEGSDQHRGWFQSSLLESCGTRGVAPYDAVLTHGFTMDEQGRKMSKSLGNQTFPQDVIKQYGADILRLWAASVEYWEDQRIGAEILKTNVDAYRKLRNTIRWMLGSLSHFTGETVPVADMPELERLMLHRLSELDRLVRQAYWEFDYKKIIHHLGTFLTVELSAFYFDVRKDALYCDPPSSLTRKASLQVIDKLFNCVVVWLAPILPFTTEEAWLERNASDGSSVHLEQFPAIPAEWRNDALAERWAKVRTVRRVVTGALEIERREKRIGSSLEARPIVHVTNPELFAALKGIDMAEIAITSQAEISTAPAPADAFSLPDVKGVAVVPALAQGRKCARSWKILPEVGSDPEFPDVTLRDAAALRELSALKAG